MGLAKVDRVKLQFFEAQLHDLCDGHRVLFSLVLFDQQLELIRQLSELIGSGSHVEIQRQEHQKHNCSTSLRTKILLGYQSSIGDCMLGEPQCHDSQWLPVDLYSHLCHGNGS